MPVVSSLFIYPIKSCAGLSVMEMPFDERGPVDDRRWMVVDESGQFVTQRTHPHMALIRPQLNADGLRVNAAGFDPITIKPKGKRRKIRVWQYEGNAIDVGNDAARWFSSVLRSPVRLVTFDTATHRRISQRHTEIAAEVAFADGYPALLLSVESLTDLNRRLQQPLPMNRFRPNIVVRDCHPFEEDSWREIEAPELPLSVVKPCERCVVTTVDQQRGVKGKEPLRTLAQFRRHEDGAVIFGQNCVHHSNGTLRVGDILRTRSKRS